jgi:PAS domain S-box-containing protein
MTRATRSRAELLAEMEALRARLEEAEETLRAIGSGEVDAFVVSSLEGDQVFTLKGAEQPYRDLVESMNEGAAMLDADGTVLYSNHSLATMLQLPIETFVGTPFVTHVESSSRSKLKALLEKGRKEQARDEITLVTGGGLHVPVLISCCANELSPNWGVNVVINDITARKQDETELKRTGTILMQLNTELDERVRLRTENLTTAIKTLKRSNQDLEQFAYVASHDLQEPLRMVASFTQLLAQKYRGKLDQEADEYIHFVVDGANRMQSLIQDLLSYSRVSSRGRQVEGVDLNQILGAVHSSLQRQIQETGAVIGHDALPTILSDASQMTQLFQNLLSNALKFRRSELPLIRVSGCDEGDSWHFTISDNGIGIEPQYFQRIFKIFQRLHTRAEYPGTGIGLAVCKRIVERHGGRIWVASEPGQGTTVHFTLSKTATNEFMPDAGDSKQIME